MVMVSQKIYPDVGWDLSKVKNGQLAIRRFDICYETFYEFKRKKKIEEEKPFRLILERQERLKEETKAIESSKDKL